MGPCESVPEEGGAAGGGRAAGAVRPLGTADCLGGTAVPRGVGGDGWPVRSGEGGCARGTGSASPGVRRRQEGPGGSCGKRTGRHAGSRAAGEGGADHGRERRARGGRLRRGSRRGAKVAICARRREPLEQAAVEQRGVRRRGQGDRRRRDPRRGRRAFRRRGGQRVRRGRPPPQQCRYLGSERSGGGRRCGLVRRYRPQADGRGAAVPGGDPADAGARRRGDRGMPPPEAARRRPRSACRRRSPERPGSTSPSRSPTGRPPTISR